MPGERLKTLLSNVYLCFWDPLGDCTDEYINFIIYNSLPSI